MPTISVDAYYGPELVEFWAHKYKKVKEELEDYKVSLVLDYDAYSRTRCCGPISPHPTFSLPPPPPYSISVLRRPWHCLGAEAENNNNDN